MLSNVIVFDTFSHNSIFMKSLFVWAPSKLTKVTVNPNRPNILTAFQKIDTVQMLKFADKENEPRVI